MIDHWGLVICEIQARGLAETFCHKSGMVHTIMVHFRSPSTPYQSLVLSRDFSILMSPNTHVQHLLELEVNSILPFVSGYHIKIPPSFLDLCGSSGSDIVLVTKAISCNLSFKVFYSFTSANALTSGSDPSDCLVLAVTGSVWLLVLEATGSSSSTSTEGSLGSSA